MDTLLTVDHLNKSFKDKEAVQDVSFSVQKGEIMAILGPNGAGKSTTIRNIMGIMYPDSGTISFSGHESIPRHRIGYLPEERGLYQNVKVMDILLYLADLKDYPVTKARERILSYLEILDLKEHENSPIEELSKGMAQKVQFISSVIHEPDLLILDEPFSGLDPVSQELIKKEIRNLAENGTAILLSSHQMDLVEEMCDRLFMMHNGKRIIYGDIDHVKERYANFKCTIHGTNDDNMLETLPDVERIDKNGDTAVLYLDQDVMPVNWLKQLPDELNLQELTLDRISLHEIFLDIAAGRVSPEKEDMVHA